MRNYIITYDLNKEWQDYPSLINAIKQYKYINWMKSVWFIKTDSTATEINTNLTKYIDNNDRLFISEITSNMNWWIDKSIWNFLN